MGRLVAFCMLVLMGTLEASSEQLRIGRGARAFHEEELRNREITVDDTPSVTDVSIFVELIGIPNFAKINELRLQIRRSNGLQNASAFEANGYRSIVYDPIWAATATADFYLALGHEAGHLFCAHSPDSPPNITQELEADRFGGASIRRFEIYHNRSFFPAVMAAAMKKYPEQASAFYPSRTARLAALKKGYDEGSPCGGLAPVNATGYSPPAQSR